MRQRLRCLVLGMAFIVLPAMGPTAASATSHAWAATARLPGVIETVTAHGQERHCVTGTHPDLHCTVFDDPRFVGLRGQHLKDGRYFYAVLTPGSETCLKDSCRGNLSARYS